MMYTRASASDYDDWETVHENPGWGSKELIPLLRKIETYQVPDVEKAATMSSIKQTPKTRFKGGAIQ